MTSIIRKNDAEFGKALIEAARSAEQDRNKDVIVKQVQSYMASIQSNEQLRDKVDRSNSLMEKRIKAVEAGEFNLSRDGKLIFTDESLLDISPLADVDFCPKCGHPLDRVWK